MRNDFFRGQFLSGILLCSSEVDVNKIGNRLKFRNILLGTLLSFTCLANISFAKADSYSAPGTVQGSNGLAGGVDSAGHIMGSNGQITGSVDSDGRIRNSNGQVTGAIDSDGRVMNSNGQVAGAVSSDGHIRGSNGQMLGAVDSAGRVMNANGQIVGAVPPGNPAVAFGMLTGQSGNNDNGTSSFAQVEAEIQQRGMPQPVQQGQPSCVIGCSAPPPSKPSQTAVIRTMDGFLVGWKMPNGNLEIKVNYLPKLHLLPSILKYSGMDISLSLDKDGIWRLVLDSELEKIAKKNPEKAMNISNRIVHGAIKMGTVNASGQIEDLQGKKIAYIQIGSWVRDENAQGEVGTDQLGRLFLTPKVVGVFEPNGDVRDVHNRLVGHLDEFQRGDDTEGDFAALKLIQKYEKQHPWHPAPRHPVKK